MAEIPRTSNFDETVGLLRDGYDFVGKRCDRLGSDTFRTRLGLHDVICMRGPAAAEFFYDGDRFTRVSGMPVTVLMLLQDYGSVQLLDDEAHRHRKALFVEVGSQARATELAALFERAWQDAMKDWVTRDRIVLFDEMEALLVRVGAEWAGAPLSEDEAHKRTKEYSAMLASTGSFGVPVLRALLLRERTEHWARDIISRTRSGAIAPPSSSPLEIVASHRDLAGNLLTPKVAAVELINVLRAIVAVGRFIPFAAKALYERPDLRKRILDGDDRLIGYFAEEVRRTSPFFPLIGGRARRELDWNGERIRKNQWVLLDLYGTGIQAATWPNPIAFDPDRFATRQPTAYDFIPQGAGDRAVTHRCPGEDLTRDLIKAAVRRLAALECVLPAQDLSVSKNNVPAQPASGVVLTDIGSNSHGDH